MNLPDKILQDSPLRANVARIWGDAGLAWLKKLPELATLFAKKWGLTGLTPAKNLSHNYVLFGQQDSKPIVLKISFDTTELKKECAALNAYNGNGYVRL